MNITIRRSMLAKAVDKVRNVYAWAVALAFMALTTPTAKAAYTIVTVDSNGDVTFVPSGLVTPILTCLAAVAVAVAAIPLLVVGVRWIFRFIKAR